MLLLLFLAGCYSHLPTPPPDRLTPDELAAIDSGASAAVLLRLVAHDETGNSLDPFGPDPFVFDKAGHRSKTGSYLGIDIGDFDSGGKVPKCKCSVDDFEQLHDFHILSTEAWNEGWLTLILPPGYYYLVGPSFPNFYPRQDTSLPRWRIEVPKGAAVIYAGTFLLHRSTGSFWVRGGLDPAATKIEDETDLALQAARRDLPSLPPPVTRITIRHTGPILLGIPPPVPSSS
jgi:hypothetical protein